ncbi:MAG TPA: hypothetical protein VJ960_09535 [Oceanipulchritudo sp.]|nr:hypothetical protein [Oceanipulchritudo sp.]
MKKQVHARSFSLLPFTLPLLLLGGPSLEAVIILSEDFESDGEGSRYSTTGSFSDGASDYFIRTDGISGPSGIPAFSGFGGNYFWAAEDIDAPENPVGLALIDFSGIALDGFFAIDVSLDIGAGSSSAFDSLDDFVLLQFRVDAGAWQSALAFQNDGQRFNSALLQDIDFDGIGDGTLLGQELQSFSSGNLPVSGTFLDLRIDTLVNAGGEAVAFDNVQVTGVPLAVIPEPATASLFAGILTGFLLFLRRYFLRQTENESRA